MEAKKGKKTRKKGKGLKRKKGMKRVWKPRERGLWGGARGGASSPLVFEKNEILSSKRPKSRPFSPCLLHLSNCGKRENFCVKMVKCRGKKAEKDGKSAEKVNFSGFVNTLEPTVFMQFLRTNRLLMTVVKNK